MVREELRDCRYAGWRRPIRNLEEQLGSKTTINIYLVQPRKVVQGMRREARQLLGFAQDYQRRGLNYSRRNLPTMIRVLMTGRDCAKLSRVIVQSPAPSGRPLRPYFNVADN